MTAATPAGPGQINIATLDLAGLSSTGETGHGAAFDNRASYALQRRKAVLAISACIRVASHHGRAKRARPGHAHRPCCAASTAAVLYRAVADFETGPAHLGFLIDTALLDVVGVESLPDQVSLLPGNDPERRIVWEHTPLVLTVATRNKGKAPVSLNRGQCVSDCGLQLRISRPAGCNGAARSRCGARKDRASAALTAAAVAWHVSGAMARRRWNSHPVGQFSARATGGR